MPEDSSLLVELARTQTERRKKETIIALEKVARKCALAVNRLAVILPFAMRPSVVGVLTTAIIAEIYMNLLCKTKL